jgi:hypothetical protein
VAPGEVFFNPAIWKSVISYELKEFVSGDPDAVQGSFSPSIIHSFVNNHGLVATIDDV